VDLTTHVREDGTAVIVVSGEIDLVYADRIRAAGLQCLAAGGCQQLTVDLLDVTFMDSSGIAALVAIRNQAESASQKLVLHRPQPAVRRVLEVTGLSSSFLIDER
jgi:stage II sporulation protein AA (anti-sigma F factor antagonist)